METLTLDKLDSLTEKKRKELEYKLENGLCDCEPVKEGYASQKDYEESEGINVKLFNS